MFRLAMEQSYESEFTVLAKIDDKTVGMLTGLDYNKQDYIEGTDASKFFFAIFMLN